MFHRQKKKKDISSWSSRFLPAGLSTCNRQKLCSVLFSEEESHLLATDAESGHVDTRGPDLFMASAVSVQHEDAWVFIILPL